MPIAPRSVASGGSGSVFGDEMFEEKNPNINTDLFDKTAAKSCDELRLSHGDRVSEAELCVAVVAPRPHLAVARQRQRVLRADRYVVDKMTGECLNRLRTIVTAGT